ncbi:MAG: hypothetical protein R3D32_02710 [Nitratireductor sp.]
MDFLVKQCGIGQRGYSRIRVFEITEDFELGDPLYSFANSEPFSIFDSSSTIYPDERNIEVMLTSGACDSNFKYYHLGDEEEAVKLVRIVAVSSHEGCEPLEYEVVPHEFIYDGYVYHKNSK